jgi:hypothetical protein
VFGNQRSKPVNGLQQFINGIALCHRSGPHLDEHLGAQVRDFYDDICRDIGSSGGDADRLGVRGLIEAVGLPLVGAQEREQPLHPFLIIDPDEGVGALLGSLDLLGKISFD